MTISALDLLLRAGGPMLLLFVAFILLRDGKQIIAARLFVPLAFCLSAFLIGNSDGPDLIEGRSADIANLLAGWTVPFLWWFCLATFDRGFHLRGPVVMTGIAWIMLAAVNRGWLGMTVPEPFDSQLSIMIGLAIVGHLTWRLLVDRSDDLVDRRRQLRPFVAVLLAIQLLIDLLVDLLLGVEWRPGWFALVQNGALILFVVWLGWSAMRSDVATLFYGSPANQRPARAANPRLAATVKSLVEDERIFLDPGLTFAQFVARTGASDAAVRQHINRELGFDHFRAFLNVHRIAEACRRLEDPAHADDKIIAIAFDCGFSSLASFNRAFSAVMQMTPSSYRKERGSTTFEDRLPSF